jgi:alpha-amylase
MGTIGPAARLKLPTRDDRTQVRWRAGKSDGQSGSTVQSLIFAISWLILLWCWAFYPFKSSINGIAAGVPDAHRRHVIVQLFNWPFTKIQAALPELKRLGYSHVHVSPPQQSNERVLTCWGRYQPVDYSVIKGPLGTEEEFREMNTVADKLDIKIIADVVLNYADLKKEASRIRDIARAYLKKLVDLGVDGLHFDAAKHIEPDFFADVLTAAPNIYAFGEVIESDPEKFPQTQAIAFYDFPLVATMKAALAFGGDLSLLRNPAENNRALPSSKAVTFVRNHDIDRGQADDRGLGGGARETFGIGWNGPDKVLTEADIVLAYAYIFGREGGIPYVFADMESMTGKDKRKDLFNDGRLVAFIRFHNLCLDDEEGGPRPEEALDLKSQNAIGWQRGKDRLVMINKSGEKLPLNNLQTTLKPGRYIEVHEGWSLQIRSDSTIAEWDLPGQTAAMFVLQR